MAKECLIQKQRLTPKFAVRQYTRCQQCGRPKSVYKRFMLCRICLRTLALRGQIPGLIKASL